MALKISKNVVLSDIVSEDNTNPITTEHILSGEEKIVELWLFNDNATKKYNTITIDPIDTVLATNEENWISLSSDGITYQATGAVLDLGATEITTGSYKFWMKVVSASVADTQNKTDLKLQVNGKEYAV